MSSNSIKKVERSFVRRVAQRRWAAVVLAWFLSSARGSSMVQAVATAAVAGSTIVVWNEYGERVKRNADETADAIRGERQPRLSIDPTARSDDDDDGDDDDDDDDDDTEVDEPERDEEAWKQACTQRMKDKENEAGKVAQVPDRDDPIEALCKEMVDECRGDLERCLELYECIFDYLLKWDGDGSLYFSSPNRKTHKARKGCGKPPPADITACKKAGGGQIDATSFDSAAQKDLADACAAYRKNSGSSKREKEARKKASEAAGDAAARGWAAQQFDGDYTCVRGNNAANDFDLVCYQTDAEGKLTKLVIVEAKGGGSPLGDRYDAPCVGVRDRHGNVRRRRVQQGTPEYVDAIRDELRYSKASFRRFNANGDAAPIGGPDLSDLIEDAYFGAGDLEYHRVNAVCSDTEAEQQVNHDEFELTREGRHRMCSAQNPECKCPPGLDEDFDDREHEGGDIDEPSDDPLEGPGVYHEEPGQGRQSGARDCDDYIPGEDD